MAAAYSLVQVLRCGLSMVRGSVLLSKSLAWLILSGDQVYIICHMCMLQFHACASCDMPCLIITLCIVMYIII